MTWPLRCFKNGRRTGLNDVWAFFSSATHRAGTLVWYHLLVVELSC